MQTLTQTTDVAFNDCASCSIFSTEINDMFIDEANCTYTAMSMYNLIEYSDNYSDASGNLWQFKRDGVPDNVDLTIDNSQWVKYKATIVGETKDAVGGNSFVKHTKLVAPLKYLSNFLSKYLRSLEMPLINCKIYLELNWIKDCTLSSAGYSAKFKMTVAKLHVPIVTLF